jgi:hypothetical protein
LILIFFKKERIKINQIILPHWHLDQVKAWLVAGMRAVLEKEATVQPFL